MSAAPWVPDRPTLPRLRAAVQECEGCELFRDATQGVMGDGDPHADLVLLGEQPGDKEDQSGEPFVGPAGKVLLGPSFKVGESRGRRLPWPEGFDLEPPPEWVLPTTHPAAVLRAGGERQASYDALVADLRLALG